MIVDGKRGGGGHRDAGSDNKKDFRVVAFTIMRVMNLGTSIIIVIVASPITMVDIMSVSKAIPLTT
eukprot:11885393-Karenia_brevis.AAC.1